MAQQAIWQPAPERVAASNLLAFLRYVEGRHGRRFCDYAALHEWSVSERADFWLAVWEFCGVEARTRGGTVVTGGERMPGARWFPEARLNFAENLLQRRDDAAALVFWGEDRLQSRVTYAELQAEVSRFAQALRAAGIVAGDRIAACLPNLPGTVIAMLAATSIGAVWSSCSPDFGVQGVLDRFGQIAPRVLIGADGYFYAGKTLATLERLAAIADGLPTLEKVIVVPYTRATPDIRGIRNAVGVHEFMAPFRPRAIAFEPLPFDHPLYILYSSGTTGIPKCIVHGAGGTLLQHLKEHRLHVDLKPGDRLFYFTTCGWMMWNWLASGLASGATLVLYDGSPFAAEGRILFDLAERERITAFGISAKYLDAAAKLGLRPRITHQLKGLASILSTGSPLAPESFDYVYRDIKPEVQLASMSGGTDLISCFVLGNPLLPVWRGEIQCAGLGMKVDVFDDQGRSLRGARGELVCTAPFPSMPIGFWNDPNGTKYRAAYYEKFPGVWCHGDYVEMTARGGMIIYGRSDAVLNPGGVRIGTAEIYRQVEQLDEVMESLAIAQDWPPERPADVRIVLFVRLREGMRLDATLVDRIRDRIRDEASPRHVPARIVQVRDIPRTKSGKIVELAVRNVVHGRPVANIEALANPEALDEYRNRAELSG